MRVAPYAAIGIALFALVIALAGCASSRVCTAPTYDGIPECEAR